ncbi:unnamed protein product, partial [Effrenium voratum]
MATPERYQKLDKIGEGSCGVVFRCRCRQTGSIVAIKKVRYSYDAGPASMAQSTLVLREVALLKSIGEHSGVAPLLDAFAEPGKLYMVFEHFDGDLARHLQEAGALPAPKLKRYAFQLLNGLTHCHTRRVAHRDLKPQNLLLKRETDELKLCDFSPSRAFVIHPSRCVLAEMAKGKAIFQASSEIGMLFNIFFQLGAAFILTLLLTPVEAAGEDAMPPWLMALIVLVAVALVGLLVGSMVAIFLAECRGRGRKVDCLSCNGSGCGMCQPQAPSCVACGGTGCGICYAMAEAKSCVACDDTGCGLCTQAAYEAPAAACVACGGDGCGLCGVQAEPEEAPNSCIACGNTGCGLCEEGHASAAQVARKSSEPPVDEGDIETAHASPTCSISLSKRSAAQASVFSTPSKNCI